MPETVVAKARSSKFSPGESARRLKQQEYDRRWYAKNAEKKKAAVIARKKNDPTYAQRQRECVNRWYANNKTAHGTKMRKWRAENVERNKKLIRDWLKKNPLKKKSYALKREAKKRNAPGICTAEQLKARIDFYGGCCAYCGAVADTVDHVVPLERGGTNWPANLRPACRSCNSSKGDKHLGKNWWPSRPMV